MELRRRDVILAAIAAFISWGYLTHWWPSLRFLPYAFSAGVIVATLAGAWAVLAHSRHEKFYRREGGPVGERKHVFFIAPQVWSMEKRALEERSKYKKKPLFPQSQPISRGLDNLLELALRDFVWSWYGLITKRPDFVNEVDMVIRAVLGAVIERALELDLVGVAVSRLVPIITSHMNAFYEAERVVRGRKLNRSVTESEELDLAIAGKYRNGKLHQAASLAYSDTTSIQQQHLRGIVMRIMPMILPNNMRTSPAVSVFVREIAACAILAPVFRILADPDTWNQLLEGYGRSLLQERKTIHKLRAALDHHAPQSPRADKTVRFPTLTPNDNDRKFERFIRAIRQCNNLSDARRFRSEVAIQLRKESAVENQDPLYIRRLETGRRMLDQRIAQLGAGGMSTKKMKKSALKHVEQRSLVKSELETATLRDILYNVSGLSYFMEYMDRVQLVRLVQFWIVVDGLRNPLEVDNDDSADYLASLPSWTESDRGDLVSINEAYLSKPELKMSPLAREDVRRFLKAGSKASNEQYYAARRAVLRTQTGVYEEMQEPHFGNFKKSDLWFKLLASEEGKRAAARVPSASSDTSSIPETYSLNDTSLNRPAKPPRAASALIGKRQDIRRAVVSSSDLKGLGRSMELDEPIRRSFDSGSSRAPLFEDDLDSEPLARSTASLDSEGDINAQNARVVDAMQAELNNIMDEQPEREHMIGDINNPSLESDSMRASLEIPRTNSPPLPKRKLTIASLGLVGEPGRRGVFDDDLFGDEEKFIEDEREDSVNNDDEDKIHEAAPGDLGLAEAIDALTMDIEKLVTQETIIDSLTKKAELTNNSAELRILRKSKASLQREMSRKELQRQQYIVQESENSLYGRATISIKDIMLATEEDGREFAMYIIEVKRQAGDQMHAATWVVARRYSEFHELNKRLRSRYPSIRNLEFPRRQVPVLTLQKDFLERRRTLLERYLREILQIPAICRSRELRAFLSQQSLPSTDSSASQVDSRDFVTRIYNSVTDGMEEFLGNIPVLDQLSLAGQNLISAATSQLQNSNVSTANTRSHHSAPDEDLRRSAEAEAELRAFETRDLEPFVKPLCDLFLEAFELNRENNWLRGRAVVLVLQQLLGGTVERKVREGAKAAVLSPEAGAKILGILTELLWPGRGKFTLTAPRSAAEKAKSRKEAGVVLAGLVPELVGSVVGRANAQAAARRLLATVNNERLNTHLVFSLVDEIVQIVFRDGGNL